ncbi:16S rRNA (cytosine(1402)-N(4))-methyltransferase RsmH [bacterium]|nr:16S rRNA (cytosine(1402)-N(4))-methyltransferase RsmH [bacterium]
MHPSVLVKEILENLAPKEGEVFLDCTINGGGHSYEISRFLGETGVLVGIDEDVNALSLAEDRLKSIPVKKFFFQGNFRNLDRALEEFGIPQANKILFDLGLSSNQLEESGRGFSFQKDEPLLMTFSASSFSSTLQDIQNAQKLTAGDIVNSWDEENIATIIESYGEERFAKRIARAIVFARESKAIATTKELAEIIENAVPARYRMRKIHPATRSFQALRIAVNDEIGALKEGLAKAWDALSIEGRIAVISFHSIEDRIVKNFFKEKKESREGKILTRKPITPSREEEVENKKSRSAKLRVIEKIKEQ